MGVGDRGEANGGLSDQSCRKIVESKQRHEPVSSTAASRLDHFWGEWPAGRVRMEQR